MALVGGFDLVWGIRWFCRFAGFGVVIGLLGLVVIRCGIVPLYG